MMRHTLRYCSLLIVGLCIHLFATAQSPVELALKSKYQMVQYHKDCGGWYLLGYTSDGQQMYGFADNNGNVVASDAYNYKIYPGHIELYLLDLVQKSKHDQWKVDYRIYEEKYNTYKKVEAEYKAELQSYKAKYAAAEKEAEAYWRKAREQAIAKAKYEAQKAAASSGGGVLGAIVSGVVGTASIAAAANSVKYEPFLQQVLANRNLLVKPSKPYNPKPTKPSEPETGFHWAEFPLRQPCKYDFIDYKQIKTTDTYADVRYDGKWGLVDATLKEVVPCRNGSRVLINVYGNGQFLIKTSGKYGVLDRTGNYIIPAEYSSIEKNGTRFLVQKQSKYGLIAYNGNVIIPCNYESIYEKLNYWVCKQNGLWGVFTKDNDELYPCQFQDVELFTAGDQLILKNKKLGLWGAIDFRTGKELFPNSYESIEYQTIKDFPDTFYKVCRNAKYGLYTNRGVLIIPCDYDKISYHNINGELKIGVATPKFVSLFEPNGIVVIEENKYDKYKFDKDHYIVRSANNKLYGVCDQFGKEIIPCNYTTIEHYPAINGFKATSNSKIGIVAYDGSELFPFVDAKEIKLSDNKKALIIKQDSYKSYGAVDFNGRIIVPCKNKSDKINSKVATACKRDTMIMYGHDKCEKTLASALTNTKANEISTKIKHGRFNFYAQNYVTRNVEEWQTKGEFEKITDWKKRVNNNTLKQRVLSLTKEAQEQYVMEYEKTKPTDNPYIVGAYDPDNETYRIHSVYSKTDILVRVDTKDAIEFKTLFDQVKKVPKFFIENDEIGLAEYHFTLPNGNKYSYNNQASLTHSLANVKYNLNTIQIDESSSNMGFKRGIQTISTNDLRFGVSDVDTKIPTTSIERNNTFVVIISNENYENDGKVIFAYNDGQTFSDYCHKALGIPKENIHFRADATLNHMKFEVNWVMDAARNHANSQIIFYYAGHGMPNPTTHESYLLPIDGYGTDYSTGYKLEDLYTKLNSVPTRSTLVILDACFTGSTRSGEELSKHQRGVKVIPPNASVAGNMVVFTATSSAQTAYPYFQQSHGLFTYYMLKWLQSNYENISLGDWYDYIKKHVSHTSITDTNILQSQNPSVISSANVRNTWRDIVL